MANLHGYLRYNLWNDLGTMALTAGLLVGACKKDKGNTEESDQSNRDSGTEIYAGGGGSGGGSFGSGDLPATPSIAILAPQGTSVTTGLQPLRFEGSCVSGLDVVLTGDVSNSEVQWPSSGALYQPCVADAFAFEINKSAAGTFRLQFAQGLLGVVPFSLPVDFSWTIAAPGGQVTPPVSSPASPPNPPVITQPGTSTSSSNTNAFTLAGTCDNGLQVVIGGHVGAQDVSAPTAGNNVANCVAGVFSFSFSKTTDSAYTVSVMQRDPQTQLDSTGVQVTWIRDTAPPSPPVVSQPSQSPFYDSASSLSLGGACEPGAQVNLSGADSMAISCSAGQFSFNSTKASDGTYNYTLSQTDAAGNLSAATSFQWVRSASVMSPPAIQSPASSMFYSRTRSLMISGSCMSNATVTLSGAVTASEVSNPSQALSRTCVSGSYSFALSKSLDGVYDLQVSQSDPSTSSVSAPVALTWIIDNIPPLAPSVVTPAGAAVSSGDAALTLVVQCERGSTVNWSGTSSGTWSGANTGSGACTDAGEFAASIPQSTDGSYTITLTQSDRAGNQSAASAVTWTKDTTMLPTPVLSSPNLSPIWTSSNTLVVSGSCTNGFIVNLSGDITASEVTSPSGALTQTCQTSTFSFTVSKSSDGHYVLNLMQADSADPPTRGDSSSVSVDWTVDRLVPAIVTITSPSQNPFTNGGGQLTIVGACETGTQVYVEGSSATPTTCVAGAYQLNLTATTSGTYSYVLKQKDRAMNTSTGSAFTWLVDTSLPPPPTVTAPSTANVLTATSELTIAGGCTPGVNVVLGGQVLGSEISAPAGSLTQACGSNGSYAFIVRKTIDGPYALDVSQERNGYYSSPVSVNWTRDTQAPATAVSLVTANPNLNATATVSFTSEAGATSQCSLDGAAYQTCTSPFSYTTTQNGTRTVYVRSTDLAGNVGTPGSVTWNQASYKTVAFYNFDSGSPIGLDSSLFPGSEHNDASQSGTATPTFNVLGKFGYGAQFTASASQHLVAPDNQSQDLFAAKMAIDAFVKLSTVPAKNYHYVIASKNGDPSGNYGWRFSLKRTSNPSQNLRLCFTVAPSGSTSLTEKLATTSFDFLTGANFHHVAMTWDAGNVKFYVNGQLVGSQTVGVVGTARINATAAPLRIGADGRSPYGYFNGVIDHLRLSQVVPLGSTFPVPSSQQTPD